MPKSKSSSTAALLKKLGLKPVNPGVFHGKWAGSGRVITGTSPIDGSIRGKVRLATPAEYETCVQRATEAFQQWQTVPAPRRGEIIRQLGNALREAKHGLGRLVTIEAGKIPAEGEGEVQEMIDICDFAVGLSRQLYGLTIASERPQHRMMEQWHPLGVVGVITSFNFPIAVWAWNSALAAVCGNATLWKPSGQTPLTAVATTIIAERVCRANDIDPAIFTLVSGEGSTIGQLIVNDKRLPLISATGSTRMGREIGEVVSRRLGRSLLELGGNNAIVVTPSANMDLATRAIVFGAVGTAGQRCTSTRRVLAHESIMPALTKRLIAAYKQVRVGDPTVSGNLMGPLISPKAVDAMQTAIKETSSAKAAKSSTAANPSPAPNIPAAVTSSPASPPRMPISKSSTTKPLRPFFISSLIAISTRPSPRTMRCPRVSVPPFSPTKCASPSNSCPRVAAIAASPM